MLIDDSPVGQSRVRAVGNDLVYCPINFHLDIACLWVLRRSCVLPGRRPGSLASCGNHSFSR